ncbi:hypothetical protein, partial [Bradyrhizobium cosmicum]|uniref:hypothetical protein n=1 Tax=Bradyrhizobium cosmicum TaxID=1404864 RepID=UPI0028EB66D1
PRKVRESIRGHGFISPAATRTVKMHRVRAFVQTDDIAEIGVRTLYHTKTLQIDARFGSIASVWCSAANFRSTSLNGHAAAPL